MASTLPQLLKAIQAGSVADVKRILTYNPSLAHQKQARDGGSPLHVAAATGNLAIVRELLQAGSTVQETDSSLEVPLHIACRQRNGASVVKELLSDAGRRSCLKALNRDGATPLHLAVQAGLLDIARLLVNAGAKVDATDRTGRTPADYVDPRLPGLSELLEAGRQLTPSRAPSGGAARTNHHASGASSAAGSGGKHRSSPFPSPGGPHHPSGHHPTTIGAFRVAGGSPGPGGARSRGGSGVVSPAGGPGGHKQQQYRTPQGRRSSSTYSSWDTSPSQAPHGTKLGFHTPVQHKQQDSGSAAAAGVAAESSSTSLASPKPPRPPAAAIAAAAVAVMHQQHQAVVMSPRRESSDWSSSGGVVEGGDNPPAAVTEQQHEQHQTGVTSADAASAAAPAAAEHHQEEKEEGVRCGLSPDLAAAAFIAAQKKQQLLAAAAAADAVEGGPTATAAGGSSTEPRPQLPQQQHHQGGKGQVPSEQQQHPWPFGPLQQQVPHAPASYAHAAPSAAAGFGSYCRGPLSLAQPQMQAVGSAAGLTGAGPSSSTIMHEHSGAGSTAAVPAAATAAVHYHQQLAAATAACQQSLQQLHGNLAHLSGQKSSSSIEPHSAAIPMGPLRSGRVAAAAAAAGAAATAATDPARASYDPQTASGAARRRVDTAANPTIAGHLPSAGAAVGGNASSEAAARRRSSSNNGMLVGNSWIVTPEASSGLLGGPLAGGSSAASHNGLTAAEALTAAAGGGMAAAAGAAAGSSAAAAEAAGQAVELPAASAGGLSVDPSTGIQQQQLQHAAEASAAGAASAGRPAQRATAALPQHGPAGVTYVTPSAAAAAGVTAAGVATGGMVGDRGQHPALAAAQQLHKQQQQLAGIAAAVAAGGYGGSSGPLQAPLLAQLGELAGKVSRLEDFVEAQVELIPDWQKALEVVTAVKRQSDDHGHLLTEQEARLATQVDFVMDLAGRVDGLSGWTQQAQQSFDKADTHFEQLEAGQAGLREYLNGLEAQLQQLQAQLTEQEAAAGVRAVTAEGQVSSLVSQLDDTNSRLDAAASRLSSVEAAAAEAQQQLQEQQQAVAAATALAAAAAEAAAAGCAVGDGSGSSRSRSSLIAQRAGASSSSTTQQAQLAESLTKQLAELKLQFGELSATVAGMSRASRVAAAFSRRRQGSGSSQGRAESIRSEGEEATAGALVVRRASVDMAGVGDQHHGCGGIEGGQVPSEVGEAWLPFMESTSACLAAHEQQIETLQSLVPKLDGVVSQRAQLINMAEQVAALQTAFNMMHHNTGRSGSQGGGVCAQGPLGTHKAAVDSLTLATSMVRLQGQMGQLTLAVEGLREEWEDATDAIKGEREAMRRDWEAERARIASAEAEVARLLAEQQAEFAEREERLIQIRAAAAEADEAARVAALESQQHVSAQLASLQAHQALMAQQLAAAHAANDTLRTELMAVQSQLAATAEAQAAMAEAQATATAAMAAAANATMRRSIQSISEDGNAAAAAAAGDFASAATAGSSRSRQRSRVQSPAEVMMAAAASAAAAAGVNSGSELHGTAGGACEYPHVFEAASPSENPFRADPTPAAAAAAALAAAAAATAATDTAAVATAATEPASLSAEPSVELEVLGQKRLVSGSVFGPSYWSGLDQARRASSGSGGSHSPRGSKLVSPPAAAPTAAEAPATSQAAAAGDAVVQEPERPEASVPQQLQQRRRRMTYDAVVTSGTVDRVRAERSTAAVESYLAGASAATAAGAGADVRQRDGVTDTYAAEMLSQGSRGMSPSGLVGGDEGAEKKKLGWFARVRLGHSSSGGGSKVKAAAATIDAAAAAVAAPPPAVTDSGDSKRLRKARAAAAAKAQKQQQLLLKSMSAAGGGDTGACNADSSNMQPVKRSAGGVLFGRWSKQARKAKAGTADADGWPPVPGIPQGRLSPAAASPAAAAYTAERGSSPALGDLRGQYSSHPTDGRGASSRGQSSGGDVRGINSDQTFGLVSAAVDAGGAWAAAGYSGKAGMGVEEEGVKSAGGKWRRRLLGARAGAQQV